MSYASLTQSNPSSEWHPWLKESVRSFFEAIPWTGQQHFSAPSSTEAGPTSLDSPMRMRVNEFFSAIPWEGKPTIAAPISPLEMQAESSQDDGSGDSLTLDGFFDLF